MHSKEVYIPAYIDDIQVKLEPPKNKTFTIEKSEIARLNVYLYLGR
jgi:hypothetical protein